jgi:hypothetical protein
MFSSLSLLILLAFHPQDAASGFRPATAPDVATRPATPLSQELRGDIFMARKMYREASEMYKQAPESAITANKTGIAYHQMFDLNMAKKVL